MTQKLDVIPPETAKTLDGLFQERVRRSPNALAYKNFDEATGTWKDYTWSDVEKLVARWQGAFEADGFQPGDRVAIVLRNSVPWVVFDQAAMGLDLVTVPLYTSDRPDNIAYIVQNSGAKLLLFENPEQWGQFAEVKDQLAGLKRVVCVNPLSGPSPDPRLKSLNDWLPRAAGAVKHVNSDGRKLASIIYTSGTTGRPKGVMLSHHNMLTNAYATLQCLEIYPSDLFLSFLPLSHTLERTCGYYGIVMCGGQTAFARSVQQLAEDLQSIRPTLLISVPRIYERGSGAIKQNWPRASRTPGSFSNWQSRWAGRDSSISRVAGPGSPAFCCGPFSGNWLRRKSWHGSAGACVRRLAAARRFLRKLPSCSSDSACPSFRAMG
jgi:long-chain acyl-CoA synthetase